MNDIRTELSIIGHSLQRDPSSLELSADILAPTSTTNKPILARSLTEGFGEVKRVCQRYLSFGRINDDNRLERIDDLDRTKETILDKQGTHELISGTPYTLEVIAEGPVTIIGTSGETAGSLPGTGVVTYTPDVTGTVQLVTDEEKVEIAYLSGNFGSYELSLNMPNNFNIGMVETVKNCMHRMMVDYSVRTLLLNQLPDKSALYQERFVLDANSLSDALRSRTSFGRRAPDWA